MNKDSGSEASINEKPVHLCVDLDGTLLKGDMLVENIARAFKYKPVMFFKAVYAAIAANKLKEDVKANFKSVLAIGCKIDCSKLLFNQTVIDFINTAKKSGRKVYLVTATHDYLARQIFDYLAIFDGYIASDSNLNLKGTVKAEILINRFGEKGFDYIGNDQSDLAVWGAARKAYAVDCPADVFIDAKKQGIDLQEIYPHLSLADNFTSIIRSLRPHQWVKNLLVFVPAFMAHILFSASILFNSFLAFIAFCCTASAVYQLNDLLDAGADRRHPTKCNRPIAAGLLSPKLVMQLVGFLLLTAAIISLLLPFNYFACFVLYLICTTAYSFYLKRVIILDIVTLSFLYALRVLSGAAATEVQISPWLLAFSLFIFFSLACIKRYSELLEKADAENLKENSNLSSQKIAGRGYFLQDLNIIPNLGVSSGLISVLVLALYINSHEVQALYNNPNFLWCLTLPLIYWISRLWILAGRGALHQDPIVFALKDRASYYLAIMIVVIMFIAN